METGWAHGAGATEAAVTLTLELSKLGLLFRRENLVESSIGFGFNGSQLAGETADGVRSRVNGGRIVTGDGGLEGLACGFHVAVHGGCGRSCIGENGGGLLLLRGRERKERGHEADPALDPVASSRPGA